MWKLKTKSLLCLMASLFVFCLSDLALAHGERAQQAGLRTRTIQWFDTEVFPRDAKINDIVTVKGKFIPSKWWPKHMAQPDGLEGAAYLNVGVPGPVFVRVDSRVNGVPMIRSTTFEKGREYEYEIKLKARRPGKYHVHPVISIRDAGPIIGPAYWVEVTGDPANFENKIETLTGQIIDLETWGMNNTIFWHSFWFLVFLAWVGYWFRKLPVLMPRYKKVMVLGDDADQIIEFKDMIVGGVFFVFILTSIGGSYLWAQNEYPITIPLQTGEVEVIPLPERPVIADVKVNKARYRIPGRSFKLDLTVTNHGESPIQVGAFYIGGIRFMNPKIIGGTVKEEKGDLIAPDGLTVDTPAIPPGETRDIVVFADDALWETYRLTSLVYDPDSRFAGLLMFYDEEGNRYIKEIGGGMVPVFT